jgi:hypothetical protein
MIQNNQVVNVIVKKRGRKSKKELEQSQSKNQDNIIVTIEENNFFNEIISNELNDNTIHLNDESNETNETNETNENDIINSNSSKEENVEEQNVEEQKPFAKKRGRKPKGGKIIQQIAPLNNSKEDKPNVILHLKCSLKDLQTNTLLSSNIDSFNFNSTAKLPYEIINNDDTIVQNNFTANENINSKKFYDNVDSDCGYDYDDEKQNKDNDIKEVWKKLKQLEHNLHINNISDKKSACFWCTYEFDNPPVYIPKHYIKDTYHVYGCFCSPECSTAYLMEENIDSSSKFERYYLINHIYSKIFDYKKNIKPAPNPYYMLDKYYGNLTIQEYRALLRNERLFLVVDKPLTRILPELHEDNDDFIINNKIIPSNTYQIKKKLQKKQQTKTNILSEKFGLMQQ